jgi:anthranilate synthase component 1
VKTLREIRRELTGATNVIPLVRDIPADTLTPVAAFLRLADRNSRSFLLESIEGGERVARYSFLGTRPFETLTVLRGVVRRRTEDGTESVLDGHPFWTLGESLGRYRAKPDPALPPFCGGAVGTIGYEMARHLEPSVRLLEPEGAEADLALFRNVAVFDHVRHRVLLIANVVADGTRPLVVVYRSACDGLDEMEEALRRPSSEPRPRTKAAGTPPGPVSAAMGRGAFLEGVTRLKRHIRAGDIFQAVLSERFEMPLLATPLAVYRALRSVNPSPYMFLVGTRDDAILGASPEMLVRVEGDTIETRPIAGTRPRGATEDEDRRLERRLLASTKERAEHLMLVDLGRNDVGRVCRPGTVRVPFFMGVERYSHVMHLVSSVRGKLRRGVSAWRALAACFPAGTVSGAPKIRAMQILAEIEPVPRGPYAGAVLYRGFGGNLDSAIAIRSLVVRRVRGTRMARLQAGAGIVADSDPAREYQEVLNKARAVEEAIRLAEGLS